MNPGGETDDVPRRSANDPLDVVHRFLKWTLICSVSAAPSLFISWSGWNRPAIITGILIYIVFYTILSGTEFARRLEKDPVVRRTLRIGYGTRMLISILYPIGGFLDIVTGMVSVSIAALIWGPQASRMPGTMDFGQTLGTTLIHGTLQNVLILIYMSVVYGLQRLFLPPAPPPENICSECGYDLRGSRHSDRCPECGFATPWSDAAERLSRNDAITGN